MNKKIIRKGFWFPGWCKSFDKYSVTRLYMAEGIRGSWPMNPIYFLDFGTNLFFPIIFNREFNWQTS